MSLAVFLVLVVSAPAASAETTLLVEGGIDGLYSPGLAVPLRITVDVDRLFSGSIEVTLTDGDVVVAQPAQIPGASIKRFTVIVPTPLDASFPTYVVRLVDDAGTEMASSDISLQWLPEVELVGVLPQLARSLTENRTIALDADLGSAKLAEIDPALLERGPPAIDIHDVIAGTEGDLAELSARSRRTLLAWVGSGGSLLVDAPVGASLATIPEQWRPTEGAWAMAGLGQIRLTSGALIENRWADVLLPTPTRTGAEDGRLANTFKAPRSTVAESLTLRSGLRLPPLSVLVVLLGVYIVIVGPVAALILGRTDRRALSWLIVPVAAMTFTAAIAMWGIQHHADVRGTHVTLVDSGPEQAWVTSHHLLPADRFEDGSVVELLDTATPLSPTPWTGLRPQIRFRDSPPTAELMLGTDDLGLVSTAALVEARPALGVEAMAVQADTVSGSVQNIGPMDLAHVTVFVHQSFAVIGELASGESAPFTVEGTDRFGYFSANDEQAWATGVGDDPLSAPDAAAWADLVTRRGTNFRPPGTAVAVGWTDERLVEDPADTAGRTAIITRSPIELGAVLTGAEVHRQIVRGPRTIANLFHGPDRFAEVVETIERHTLPPTYADDGGGLVVDVGQSTDSVAVLVAGEWVDLDTQSPIIDLAAGAVRHGSIIIRYRSSVGLEGSGTRPITMIRDRNAPARQSPR